MWSQLNWQTSLNHPAFQLDNRKDNDGVVFASIAYGRTYAQLTKFETIFATFLLGCSALRPNSAHLRFSRMYGIVFIPAMRQRKE